MTVESHSRRILVVDDSPSIRAMLARTLERLGYHVGIAENGQDGLEKFRGCTWDLVITDLQMPYMSGEEMAAAIKAEVPAVPVIIVTGSQKFVNDPGMFHAFFPKPFQFLDLLKAIEGALQ